MPQVKKDLPENKVLSELIYLIAEGNNYAQKIHDEIGKDPSSIIKQLNKLKENNYIKIEKEEGRKVIYSVNYSSIIELFINFLNYRLHNPGDDIDRVAIKGLVDDEKESETQENVLFRTYNLNKEFINKIKKNKYLIKYFKTILSYYPIREPLNKVFERIIYKNTGISRFGIMTYLYLSILENDTTKKYKKGIKD